MKNVFEIVDKALKEERQLRGIDFLSIITQLISRYDIEKYVNDISIHCNLRGIAGYYDYENYILNFDYLTILNNASSTYSNYIKQKGILYCEHVILQQIINILHEIRHVIQQKKLEEEVGIVKDVLMDCIKGIKIGKYNEYYNIFPNENDADIFAFSESIDLFQDISANKICEKILYIILVNKLGSRYFDYFKGKEKSALIYQFADKVLGDIDYYKNIYNECYLLEIFDKMSFGLPLTKEDNNLFKKAYVAALSGNNPKKILVKK